MVQHPAVRRHLTLALARQEGVAASLAFPTPTELLHLLLGTPSDDPWHRGPLAWRIAAALSLPSLIDLLPPPLRRTIRDPDPLPRLTFTRRVAACLHNLMLYRPAIVIGWERGASPVGGGPDEPWQRALWQALQQMLEVPSPLARYLAWQANAGSSSAWPSGLLLVSDATLPPLLREVLVTAAQTTSIRWYLLSPMLPPFTPAQPRRRAAALAAVRTLSDVTEASAPDPQQLAPVGTLLGAVQEALTTDQSVPRAWTTADESLLVHRCHSPVREIETLRDHLAARLAADRSLAPEDVTLYVTSLPEYLSAVDAVFGVAEPGYQAIPYQVAGRPWHQRAPIGAAITALWDVLTGRFERSSVLALLDHLPVRRASGLRAADLSAIRELVDTAWIRWGVDARDRAEHYGLPEQGEGTWVVGLDRLAAQHQSILEDEPEDGSTALLVRRLRRWVERLIAGRRVLHEARSAVDWRDAMSALLGDLVHTSGSEDTMSFNELLRGMQHLLHELGTLDRETPLPFATLRPLLLQAIDQQATSGHLRGGMRVCRLEPGTVLPARVVLIAGLDDTHFPPRGALPAWDLLVQSHAVVPRDPTSWEDPDPREEALDAFQDALRSARDGVHLTWTGRSILDHAVRAPSIALDALLDLVDRVATRGDGGSVRQAILTDEPLQPFAPTLFGANTADSTTRSPRQAAATRWATAAQAVAERPTGDAASVVFLSDPLPPPSPTTEVALAELADALAHPIEYFWLRTLGLPRPPRVLEDEDREPILREDHEEIAIATRWLERAFLPVDQALAELPAVVEVAPGALGRAVLAAGAAPLAVAREASCSTAGYQRLSVDLSIDGVRITGSLDQVDGDRMTVIVPYQVGTKTLLRTWVRHLALNACLGAAQTHLIGVGKETKQLQATLLPVQNPQALLADLLALHEALGRGMVFLPPRTAMAVAAAQMKAKDVWTACSAAWNPDSGFRASARGERKPGIRCRDSGLPLAPSVMSRSSSAFWKDEASAPRPPRSSGGTS